MSDLQTKLIYNSTLMRIKVELSREQAVASSQPQEDLVTRSRAKMETAKASGEILEYEIFEERLIRVWNALRGATDLPDDFKLTMTLAAGLFHLAGVRVEKANKDKSLVNVSISAPSVTFQSWRYEWFKAFVELKARELGVTEQINNAQIYSAYVRGLAGDPVEDFSIGNTLMVETHDDKPFFLVASKQRQEIFVVILRVNELGSQDTMNSLLLQVRQAVSKMSKGEVRYLSQEKDLKNAIQSMLEGPEMIGEGLPAILLAAHASFVHRGTALGVSTPGHIHFTASEDNMNASISGFDLSYYQNFDVSPEWVQAEMKRCSIKLTIKDDVSAKLTEMILSHRDLNGFVVCSGVAAVSGQEPYIYQSFKDAASKTIPETESFTIDLRDLQQKTMVKEGELIAEIRHIKPAEAGCNIYGDVIEAAANEDFAIQVGEGVERKGRRFYATFDGVPVIDNQAISLNKSMIVEGDVNLRSGNIRFDGPVEIHGSIDTGSVVMTKGDLIVHGTIRGAHVKASGSITVYSGIITGTEGRIYAGGDVKADFVENSSVTCGGNLIVSKALLNCRIFCNGSIHVRSATGVLAGGKVICRERVKTSNLGFKRGASTDLVVGVDWRIAKRIEIQRERLLNLEKASHDYRLNLRTLVQKSSVQLTQKYKAMKEEMQQKLVKSKTIIERVQKTLQESSANLTFNPESKIFVVDQLSSNVKIQLCHVTIVIAQDFAKVALVPNQRRGSNIVPLEEIEAEERAQQARK